MRLARGPRNVDVYAEVVRGSVISPGSEHRLDLERVPAAERHLQDVLQGLHGRDLVRSRPPLVVEVVRGYGVVRGGDAREALLRLLLLLRRVLVGVPLEAELAVRLLDLIYVALVRIGHLEDGVRLVQGQRAVVRDRVGHLDRLFWKAMEGASRMEV